MATINKISPCLWFDGQAEEAAKFYTGIFRNSKLGKVTRYTEAGQEVHKRTPGSVMTVEFQLEGLNFVALNGGPDFKFSEAISFQVNCETQQEVDQYWDKLSEGGNKDAQQCGWLKDKFGLSWQIVPMVLPQLLADPDKQKASRVMNAMLKMKKLDIQQLQKAATG